MSDVDLRVGAEAAVELRAPDVASPAPASTDVGVKPSGEVSRRTLGYITWAGAAALIVAGVAVGAEGLSARNSFNTSGYTDADEHDSAIALRTTADVLFGLAAAGAATGLVLVLTSPASQPAKASLHLTPRAATVSVAF